MRNTVTVTVFLISILMASLLHAEKTDLQLVNEVKDLATQVQTVGLQYQILVQEMALSARLIQPFNMQNNLSICAKVDTNLAYLKKLEKKMNRIFKRYAKAQDAVKNRDTWYAQAFYKHIGYGTNFKSMKHNWKKALKAFGRALKMIEEGCAGVRAEWQELQNKQRTVM